MSDIPVYRNYINGEFSSEPTSTIDVFNPANGSLLSKVPNSSAEEVDQAIHAARSAQASWSQRPAIERATFPVSYTHLTLPTTPYV